MVLNRMEREMKNLVTRGQVKKGSCLKSSISGPKALGWCGAKQNYDIGSTPSKYVASKGVDFFLRNLVFHMLLLLDLGAWRGRHIQVLKDLAGPHGEVVAVDGPWAHEAIVQLRQDHPDIRAEESLITNLPFKSGSIGGMLCWRVLHSLVKPNEFDNAMKEIHRVLKVGAPLLVAVRAWARCNSEMPFLMRRGLREDLYFSESACESEFAKAGFCVEKVESFVEEEVVDGVVEPNVYYACHLIRK